MANEALLRAGPSITQTDAEQQTVVAGIEARRNTIHIRCAEEFVTEATDVGVTIFGAHKPALGEGPFHAGPAGPADPVGVEFFVTVTLEASERLKAATDAVAQVLHGYPTGKVEQRAGAEIAPHPQAHTAIPTAPCHHHIGTGRQKRGAQGARNAADVIVGIGTSEVPLCAQ